MSSAPGNAKRSTAIVPAVAIFQLVSALAAGCAATDQQDSTQSSLSSPFRGEVERVVVEVDAMDGELVHFGPLSSGVSPWEITRANLARAFDGLNVEVQVPSHAGQVGGIETNLSRFTEKSIDRLSRMHRSPEGGAEVRFHVMFLAGPFDHDDQDADKQVAALHLAGSRTIAVFGHGPRDTPPAPELATILQQVEVVHELGHALGLVGIETPAVEPHEQPDSRNHCTNPTCIMAGVGALPPGTDALLTAQPATEAELLLLGPQCLQDLDARRTRERASTDHQRTQ